MPKSKQTAAGQIPVPDLRRWVDIEKNPHIPANHQILKIVSETVPGETAQKMDCLIRDLFFIALRKRHSTISNLEIERAYARFMEGMGEFIPPSVLDFCKDPVISECASLTCTIPVRHTRFIREISGERFYYCSVECISNNQESRPSPELPHALVPKEVATMQVNGGDTNEEERGEGMRKDTAAKESGVKQDNNRALEELAEACIDLVQQTVEEAVKKIAAAVENAEQRLGNAGKGLEPSVAQVTQLVKRVEDLAERIERIAASVVGVQATSPAATPPQDSETVKVEQKPPAEPRTKKKRPATSQFKTNRHGYVEWWRK